MFVQFFFLRYCINVQGFLELPLADLYVAMGVNGYLQVSVVLKCCTKKKMVFDSKFNISEFNNLT